MDTVTTALGALERCPSCFGMWMEQKLIAAYSDDKVACRDALAETQVLLLPVDRWCPKCFQKMFDGRVGSRSVVLHLCTHCEAVWTDWDTLQRFDEFVGRALKAQVETATQASVTLPQGQSGATGVPLPTLEDNSMAKVFRTVARTFDTIADGIASTSAYPLPVPGQKPEPVKPPLIKSKDKEKNKDKKADRKILKADELPPEETVPSDEELVVAPAPTPEPAAIVEPEAVKPTEPLLEAPPPVVEEPLAPRVPVVLPPLPSKSSVSSQLPDLMSMLEALEALEAQEVQSAPVPVLEPTPDLKPEPPPVVPTVNKEPDREGANAISNLLGGSWNVPEKKIEKKFEKTPEEKPVQAEPAKKPVPETPVEEPRKPVPVAGKKPAAVAKPVVVKPPKKEGPGVVSRLFGAFKPKPKTPKAVKAVPPAIVPAKPAPVVPAPILAPTPAPIPVKEKVAPPPPVPVAAEPPKGGGPVPVVPKPPKVAAKPKPSEPKKVSVRTGVGWRLVPWGLACVAFAVNYARGYDFEWSFALLWSTIGWAVGQMVRLAMLYPFKDFADMTLAALFEVPGLTAAKGLPVILEGLLELEDPAKPKGKLVFVQEGQRLAVNTFGGTDILCRFFGLKNPAQLIAGPVTLQGWFRNTATPYIEVGLLIAGKKRRSSMVRAVRWVCAGVLLAIAGLVLLTAE
jgi:Zn-finger nucleic acid-binding protein